MRKRVLDILSHPSESLPGFTLPCPLGYHGEGRQLNSHPRSGAGDLALGTSLTGALPGPETDGQENSWMLAMLTTLSPHTEHTANSSPSSPADWTLGLTALLPETDTASTNSLSWTNVPQPRWFTCMSHHTRGHFHEDVEVQTQVQGHTQWEHEWNILCLGLHLLCTVDWLLHCPDVGKAGFTNPVSEIRTERMKA